MKVSAQIWRSASGIERVWGLGTPVDTTVSPLLYCGESNKAERHSYVRNEDREWLDFEPKY